MKPIIIPTSILCSLGCPSHTDPAANASDQAKTERNTQSSVTELLEFSGSIFLISEDCNIPIIRPLITIAITVGNNWKYSPPVLKVLG